MDYSILDPNFDTPNLQPLEAFACWKSGFLVADSRFLLWEATSEANWTKESKKYFNDDRDQCELNKFDSMMYHLHKYLAWKKKRGEQKHINSWKVSDSSPKGYGAPKAMGNSTLVFFSCLKGLLGVWLSSRFVTIYIYISEKELTENVGSLMSLSCLSGSFSVSWTELPLQCFYLPWKNNALGVKDQLLQRIAACTKKRDVMMSGNVCFPSKPWCWLGI